MGKADGYTGTFKRATASTSDLTLCLGDLRELVVHTEGMGDAAMVTVSALSQSHTTVGECYLKRLWVREEQVD
jgi:hypothetical protein